MAHQYKRRTYDEAMELAQQKFREECLQHLTTEDIEAMRQCCSVGGGPCGADWADFLGWVPDQRLYYEVQLYRPTDICPYIDRFYARILVSRDRSVDDGVWIIWKPPVPEYHGPHFT